MMMVEIARARMSCFIKSLSNSGQRTAAFIPYNRRSVVATWFLAGRGLLPRHSMAAGTPLVSIAAIFARVDL
jgi:hypothetical protein